MNALLLFMAMLSVLSACAPLGPNKTAMEDVGEFALRAVACPLTLCVSEVLLKAEETSRQREREYWAWYARLSPEQQHREDARQAARMQAYMVVAPGFQALSQPSVVEPRHTPRCVTQQFGGTFLTDCQ